MVRLETMGLTFLVSSLLGNSLGKIGVETLLMVKKF
jgi:hypothetical protein